jgi:hypothetical protein
MNRSRPMVRSGFTYNSARRPRISYVRRPILAATDAPGCPRLTGRRVGILPPGYQAGQSTYRQRRPGPQYCPSRHIAAEMPRARAWNLNIRQITFFGEADRPDRSSRSSPDDRETGSTERTLSRPPGQPAVPARPRSEDAPNAPRGAGSAGWRTEASGRFSPNRSSCDASRRRRGSKADCCPGAGCAAWASPASNRARGAESPKRS